MNAIVAPYNALGETIPCALVSGFSVSADGIQKKNCIVNTFDKVHQIIKIRVENIGNLAIGQYKLTLDYFLLPSLVGLLQQSNTFMACLHYFSATTIH